MFFKKFEIQAYSKAFSAGQGLINWRDYLSSLKQPMNSDRRELVERVFDSLDLKQTGTASIQTLSNIILI